MTKTMTASEMGKKSAAVRRKKYGKNFPKVMSELRKGKKIKKFVVDK